MNDDSLPTYLHRGLALSNADLCTELGTELLALCKSVTADGRMAPEELTALKQWLSDAQSASMPAAKHLRGFIEKVLADGRITADEYQQVLRAVESVLPFEARREAIEARLAAEATEASTAPAAVAQARILRIFGIVALLILLGLSIAWLIR